MIRKVGMIGCLAVGVWLAGCGGGTLGGGAGGGGITSITGVAAAGGAPAGGISGAAGIVGTGGFSGSMGSGFGGSMGSGFGGSGFISCPPPPPICGTLCGNGRRDTCARSLGPGCPTQTWTEDCDGNDFGGDSCGARGFAGGALVCRGDCTVDDSGCSDCAPIGGSVISCGRAPIQFTGQFGFGIAATDTEVGIAALGSDNLGGTTLSLARLTPSLDLAGTVQLEATAAAGSTTIYATAVAPLSSGWIVAGCGYPQVFIHRVDASGREVARAVVDRISDPYDACITGSLVLASRPGGGPLLLWRSGWDTNLHASLVADDGLSAGAPQTIAAPPAFLSDTVSAAWIGDAFYIAATIESPPDYRGVLHLVRFPPGGTPTGGDVPISEDVYSPPAIAAGAPDLRVVYDSAPLSGVDNAYYTVLWRRLGPSGEPLSAPVTVGTYLTVNGPPRAVAFGDETLVVIGDNYTSGRITLVHLGSDGQIAAPGYDLARTPRYYVGLGDIVRRGPDAVVAWTGSYGSLYLARVTP